MNYNNRRFKVFNNSENGEVDENMVFHYRQEGQILWCDYDGLAIQKGHLLGKVDDDGAIEMRYHQVLKSGEIQTGICQSKPEIQENGKIKLLESWQWTSGDRSSGSSVLMEI